MCCMNEKCINDHRNYSLDDICNMDERHILNIYKKKKIIKKYLLLKEN